MWPRYSPTARILQLIPRLRLHAAVKMEACCRFIGRIGSPPCTQWHLYNANSFKQMETRYEPKPLPDDASIADRQARAAFEARMATRGKATAYDGTTIIRGHVMTVFLQVRLLASHAR